MKNTFITNNETAFLKKIKESLQNCISFSFSVSFIKYAGLVLIEREIEEALERGVQGRIITSTYQNFTDIPSLNKFLDWSKKYSNFHCHLDFQCFGENGFHSKGYIFEYGNSYEIIVGSTNITRFALLRNVEWNIALHSKEKYDSYVDANVEFNDLWNKTIELDNELIKKYKIQLDYAIDKWDMDFCDPEKSYVRPNAMQRKALKEIRRYRDLGVKKALVVSATGSGKTYLAAFDARNFDAKRLLFVVHRDAILSEAKVTFENVFGASKSYGLYTGKKQDIDCDFVFATNTMISKHLDDFDKNEFDYIVLDEAHHVAASTYRSIMQYFNPEFVLGLTATPERMDNEDVFELFDQNVPYELRLNDAINNNLVVPFHYYGIRDDLVDYSIEDKNKIAKEISKNDNIAFIHKEIQKHLPDDKLKAIAFCSSIAHAELMAEEFNNIGYCSVSLTGSNDLGQRLKAFNDLQDEDNELQIICTVDILNEGVDIPAVNMILFLRPTESSTIFLQQLGRGLRKYINKEYVTVLDFIGNNYDRSVQIATALGTLGRNTSVDKKTLMCLVNTSFKDIGVNGVQINIDELSREEIIKFISNTNFNKKEFLKKDYFNFKKFLNCSSYPKHIDYLNCEYAPNILRFMKSKIGSKKNFSYYNFLHKIGEENLPIFDDDQVNIINELSELLPLVRVDEYLIIKQLIETNEIKLNELIGFNNKVTFETLNHALLMIKKSNLILDNDTLNLKNINVDFEVYIKDLIQYGLSRYEIEFGNYEGKFKLYANYYKSQIMNVLLENSTMFMKGTKFDEDGTTYVFVGIKKDKEKEEKTNYKDKFISPSVFQWEAENNTTYDNSIGRKLLSTKIVHVFVRKIDEEDGITSPFTYFGTGVFTNTRKSKVKKLMDNGTTKEVDTLLFDIELDNEVPEEYHFEFEVPEVVKA